MKIEKSGITITEVPGIHKITVERTGEGPISIMIHGEEGISGEWGVEALTGLHEAIGVALEHAASMVTAVTPTSSTRPRVFDTDSMEPGQEVTAVKDADGDIWIRTNSGWRLERVGSTTYRWHDIVDYGPFTEEHR